MESGQSNQIHLPIKSLNVQADINHFPTLNMTELGPMGMLVAGMSSRIDFAGFVVEITFEPDSSRMVITHEIEGKIVSYACKLTTSTPYLGGTRYWFLCPKCDRRVYRLHKRGNYFLCRTCHNLRSYQPKVRNGNNYRMAGIALRMEANQQQPGRENGNQQDQGTQGNVVLADS